MAAAVVTKERIVEDLKTLGLKAGDIVLVHSSLASLGRVEGGAGTVVEALLEALTPAGTLLMPTFAGRAPFDLDRTPSGLGAITEAFRRYPGARRSLHPTHSVAALGPKAGELIADHIKSPTACGRVTPYGRLIEMGGKILLLGVDHDRSTTLHTLEDYADAPYLSDKEARYLDADGVERSVTLTRYPGPHRDFIGLDPLLRRSGAELVGKVAGALSRLIDARKMHDVVLAAMADDPALVLCDNPSCADCVMQRRKIRLARLRGEDFTLSALASSVSAYPDEIAAELHRAGIRDLVVDRLFGKPVWAVDRMKLVRALESFSAEGIAVGAVYVLPDPAQFERAIENVALLKPEELIVTFPPAPRAFVEAAERRGLRLLFENATLPSSCCLELLQSAGEGPGIAFNPTGFAMLGERPFLKAYRTGLRHRVGMLFVNDATFGGAYTLPGRGNAEIKELISILRCRSFAGRMVIATGPGGPGFRDSLEAFWGLLESM